MTRAQELDLSLCTTLLLIRTPGTWNLFQAVDGPLGMSRHFHKVLRVFSQPQVVVQGQLLVQLVKDNDEGSIMLQISATASAPTKWRTGEVLAKP